MGSVNIEVEIDGDWETILSVNDNCFINEKRPLEVGFRVNESQKEKLKEYSNQPLKLSILVEQEFYFAVFKVWAISKNNVIVINPNRNFEEFSKNSK